MVDRQEAMRVLKDWRVQLWIVTFIIIGLLPLLVGPYFNRGLQFGMDFKGGTLIQLQLEKDVDSGTMSTITTILQDRLNKYGLKDISVKPYGTQFITVAVSATDPASVQQVKGVLSQQGRFEAIIDGQVVLHSSDLVKIITDPQKGYGYISSTGQWRVPFVLSKEGSERFAKIAAGRCTKVGGETKCDKIYMYIDRPENAVAIAPDWVLDNESVMSMNPANPAGKPIKLEDLENNSLTKFVKARALTPDLVRGFENYTMFILHPEVNLSAILNNTEFNVTGSLEEGQFWITDKLTNKTIKVRVVPKPNSGYWSWGAVNLESILNLTPGVTSGRPIREAVIEGYAPDWMTASQELNRMVVVLKSGKLPVSISLASTNTVSPTLGESFIGDIVKMALIAWVMVALVTFLRYREPKITLLMMAANVSEVLIILGIAALIGWQIDIASVAGVIAVVGTGVDQFIIITDEIEMKGVFEETIVEKVKKAFRIIMGSAMTTLAAMLPLLTLGLGLLKGFAITTIVGLFVGIVIVRPAFARVIEKIL
ncbi:MAG: hypothetical protein J7L23_00255 [Candidatus Diapherotrites archaeon]|nr:hypothetical protein [Candidatus Diapherotrites archaeon]